jgi:hypothetical protein
VIRAFSYDTLAKADIATHPGMAVSVIGFPFGLRLNAFLPIWKTGHIATDVTVPLGGKLPCFLIDATTRSGMSGSPVVQRAIGIHPGSDGNLKFLQQLHTKFLGIYSGRIQDDAELGYVWQPRALTEMLEQAVPGRNDLDQ